MNTSKVFNVLFLSRRNSARSIMAEALLNHLGKGRFNAFSAGVSPTESVDPVAYELLDHAHVPYAKVPPRHYREFALVLPEPLDFIFTLSDTAAGEPMPVWPGLPVSAHWRSEDPQNVAEPAQKRLALIRVRGELERRLRVFMNLPLESLDRMSLQQHLDAIGEHP